MSEVKVNAKVQWLSSTRHINGVFMSCMYEIIVIRIPF